jgi:chemotaxis protein methyltransferase WspC
MVHSAIYTFLRDITGIDVLSIGEEAVDRVVGNRMKANGHSSIASYFLYLKTSPSERQALINEVTVPETWFFRDGEPFKLFSDYVSKAWSPQPGQKLKVLSIPCSTGEEPYSLAMALLDAGFTPDSFTIDAADISTRVLDLAQRGVYGRNSFRCCNLSFRDKYFSEKGGFYELTDEVKSAVSFHHQNVLATDFMQGRGPYNVIFCRNLLIYFDLVTKERVIRSLRNLMFADGLLFLGHAETGRMVHGLFESMRHPGAFAYQPVGSTLTMSSKRAVKSIDNTVLTHLEPPVTKPEPDHEVVASVSAPVQHEQENHVSIDEIQALADKGELRAAMQLCGIYIQRNPVDADGYYLQGIIFLAEDEDEKALGSFKRAIYLEPNHYQSLAHLSVLAEERGESQAAANYRARMARAKTKL